jgi:Rieske 2Fe-2S family protein
MYDRTRILDLLDRTRDDYTLPQAFYTDADLYEFDVSAVFSRSWVMIGIEAELPEPGSAMAVTIGRNPVVVVRGRDGVIRGFHNTCRHRGSQICADGHSRSIKLMCPYHKWTNELDGSLIGAPRMPPDFRPGDHALRPVPVELLAGCIYIALSNEAPDFSPFRAAVAPLLAPYKMADAKVAFESTLVEKANWKLVMENARECYHCGACHPELKRSYPVSVGRDSADTEYSRGFAARMEKLGLSTAMVEGASPNGTPLILGRRAYRWTAGRAWPDGSSVSKIRISARSGGPLNRTISAMRSRITLSCSLRFPRVRRRLASSPNGWSIRMQWKVPILRSMA